MQIYLISLVTSS